VLILGGDSVSYGDSLPSGQTYREHLLEEVSHELDLSRVHFLGQVSYEAFLNVLQLSTVHVYLTYPFVLSWSFVEALSAGCVIIGSATTPVQEVLSDRENGLLVDFFSTHELSERIGEVLEHPDRMQDIRDAARTTAIRHFDLSSTILPRWRRLINDLVDGTTPELLPPIGSFAPVSRPLTQRQRAEPVSA
jgi:glycosyltransferase involved in cell wall biosynthesis